MADTKISALPASTTPLAGTEVLPIVQGGATKKVSTDDLTVKNVRSNATNGVLQIAGPAAASTRVMTTPDANFTAARTDAAQSFTGDQTLSTGNLVIGTSGKGIDFSATPGTGTSELLADYEEGTWTPTDASGAGLTLTSQSGVYTKIGNTVYFNCVAQYPVTADASLFKIGGLPFAPNTDGGASVGYTTYATAGALFVQVSNAVNGLRLLTTSGAFLTNADMSNALITITGTLTTN
jgi:hypothetical protein